jgi:hypothetical protein
MKRILGLTPNIVALVKSKQAENKSQYDAALVKLGKGPKTTAAPAPSPTKKEAKKAEKKEAPKTEKKETPKAQ